MAEGLLDEQRRNKYFCHSCSVEINPKLPEFTCPRCHEGFIEELTHDLRQENESAIFNPYSGRSITNLLSSRRPRGRRSSETSTGDHGDEYGYRQFLPAEYASSRRRGHGERAVPLHSFIENLLSGMRGHSQRGAQGVDTLFQDDLDVGGLDDIVSQLLGQLASSGPPPAPQRQIDSLPIINITQQHVDEDLQCSVCMEYYTLAEEVRSLPCSHIFHVYCIGPWLQLHGTCPVCRHNIVDLSSSEGVTTATPSHAGLRRRHHADLPSRWRSETPPLPRRDAGIEMNQVDNNNVSLSENMQRLGSTYAAAHQRDAAHREVAEQLLDGVLSEVANRRRSSRSGMSEDRRDVAMYRLDDLPHSPHEHTSQNNLSVNSSGHDQNGAELQVMGEHGRNIDAYTENLFHSHLNGSSENGYSDSGSTVDANQFRGTTNADDSGPLGVAMNSQNHEHEMPNINFNVAANDPLSHRDTDLTPAITDAPLSAAVDRDVPATMTESRTGDACPLSELVVHDVEYYTDEAESDL